MSLTAQQRQTLLASESLGDWGRRALEAEVERLTKIRDGLPLPGVGGGPRDDITLILYDMSARLAVPDPPPPADRAAVEARLAERRTQRATMAAFHEELARATPGSATHGEVLDDLIEFSRATTEDGAA